MRQKPLGGGRRCNFFSIFFFGQCNDALLVNEGEKIIEKLILVYVNMIAQHVRVEAGTLSLMADDSEASGLLPWL